MSQVNSDGSVTQTTINSEPGGPATKAPTAGAGGTFKYWDVIGSGGSSTDYFNRPPFLTQPPNPQIAVGPDDILTVVNRTIVRYRNPNAGNANAGFTNPYFNPPTDGVWLDTWLGITNLASLCPSGTGNNAICVIDNASIRYDQMQGRFVVLFTVTDMPAHRSNFVLILSKTAQFNQCGNTTPLPVGCGGQPGPSSPLFTPPVIAPFVGGTSTGGINTANWYYYAIPINVTYTTQPTALGKGIAGTYNNGIATNGGTVGGTSNSFVTVSFCANGGPPQPLISTLNAGVVTGTLRSCTNYFPTGARMGLDNDNIVLTAPVLDMMVDPVNPNVVPEGTLPTSGGVIMGPYAGTRVTSVAKLVVYNGTSLGVNQPGVSPSNTKSCTANSPVDCVAVNLSDNIQTGTLTGQTFTINNVVPPTIGNIVNCATIVPATAIANNVCAATNRVVGPNAPNPIAAIYWEPDNLRGRALASFDTQVSTVGVLTPIDYLVGTAIADNFGQPSNILGNIYFLQPLIYSCPGVPIFPGPSGVTFCGTAAAGQVADLANLGPLKGGAPVLNSPSGLTTLASVANPNTVGQGLSALSQVANDGTSVAGKRLFVGDSRPSQVMFREGLLYVARTVRLLDNFGNNPLGTSTVLYDIIRTCSTAAPNPTCSGAYSPNGTNLGTPFLALETEWFNGQNVVDQAGNLPGFGFYTPMFESPADVTAAGPTSPIALFPWLEKLFVGMTTGGTSNLAATFSKDFPSLWDYRPGDDAFDTAEPYVDPYTGFVRTTVPCPGSISVVVLSKSGSTITVVDPTGLGVGMIQLDLGSVAGTAITAISGNVITLSTAYPGTTFPVTLSFGLNGGGLSVLQNVIFVNTAGVTNADTLGATNGVAIGQTVAGSFIQKTVQFNGPVSQNVVVIVGDTSGVGVGETVTAVTTKVTATPVLCVAPNGPVCVTVPLASKIAVGETVTGTGLSAGVAVSRFIVNPNDASTLLVTLTGGTVSMTTATSLTFDPTPCITNAPSVSIVGTNSSVTLTPAASISVACNTASQDAVPVNNGVTLQFTVPANFFTGTVVNISGAVVTLSNANAAPPSGAGSASSYPVTFNFLTTNCPMIPWSSRGGASTDPNDGSLWLFGAFAKQRLASVPGPGQWGTSVANYALDFPAVDPYNNDNTFFGDVPAGGQFFVWIQIAKNLGIAQPTATGPCPTNPAGNPPIQQPPAGGGTPNPGTPQLLCPFFSPAQNVTRAEMAYWVIRSQMDETMVSNYLCATGGDPAGIAACALNPGIQGSTFADLGAVGASITNPFLPSSGITQAMMMRYIEVMARRGYTKGCQNTDDPLHKYCPNDLLTRGQMSVFLIRAKMNNVFPTTLSGIPLIPPYGDNFGLFAPPAAYFSDVTQGATDPYKDFYIYIQKMRELRITNGTTGSTFSPGSNITRQEIATFTVRAFFL